SCQHTWSGYRVRIRRFVTFPVPRKYRCCNDSVLYVTVLCECRNIIQMRSKLIGCLLSRLLCLFGFCDSLLDAIFHAVEFVLTDDVAELPILFYEVHPHAPP